MSRSPLHFTLLSIETAKGEFLQQEEWELDPGKDFLPAGVREVRDTLPPTPGWSSQRWG